MTKVRIDREDSSKIISGYNIVVVEIMTNANFFDTLAKSQCIKGEIV